MSSLLSYLLLLTALVCGSTAAAELKPVYDYDYEYEEDPVETPAIPRLSSLQQLADSARSKNVPILVEFTTPWCRYCEALEQQVLMPLILNGEYRDRIIVQKLQVDSYSSVTGFDGRQYSSDQISRLYQVDLYPTLVFFNANGEEVSQRIVGITVLEYVAGELEKAIDTAVKATTEAL